MSALSPSVIFATSVPLVEGGENRSGGTNRALQIRQGLLGAGVAVSTESPVSRFFSRKERYGMALRYRREIGWQNLISTRAINHFAVDFLGWHSLLSRRSPGTLVTESCWNLGGMLAARELGWRIVALPAALVHLWKPVDSFFPTASVSVALQSELQALRLADAIFTISREEQWLLANHEVRSEFLPYYPPGDLAGELLEDRQKRAGKSRNGEYLIIATLGNTDSKEGFAEQAAWLRDIARKKKLRIHVVGSSCETLKDLWRDGPFEIHGLVSKAKLRELRIRCDALLLHMHQGLGSLTRIPESLIAGLPVVANHFASRSNWGRPGLFSYSECDEFGAILAELPTIAPLPAAPERELQQLIRSLYSAN